MQQFTLELDGQVITEYVLRRGGARVGRIRRAKRGAISFGELGRRSAIRASDDLSGSYMGYVLKR